jgi:hypothetical protein
MNTKFKIAAILAIGGTVAFAAAPAMARVNVDLNIGGPGVYYPAPVYVQPQPVYVQPQPVYVQPAPVYGYGYQHGWNRGHHYGWRDNDGDGVPNRYDRAPNNPYRR